MFLGLVVGNILYLLKVFSLEVVLMVLDVNVPKNRTSCPAVLSDISRSCRYFIGKKKLSADCVQIMKVILSSRSGS